MSTKLLNPSDVEQSLFQETYLEFNLIAWQGKVEQTGGMGFWTMDREGLSGEPESYWEATEFKFGTDPNSEPKPITRHAATYNGSNTFATIGLPLSL